MYALNIKIAEQQQNGCFRRFSLNEPSYDLLISTMRRVCAYGDHVQIQTSYRDDEGDEVVFASDEEFSALIALFPTLLRINVTTSNGATALVETESVEMETEENPFASRLRARIEKVNEKIADGTISEEKGNWLLEKLETKLKEGPRKGGCCPKKGKWGGKGLCGPQAPETKGKWGRGHNPEMKGKWGRGHCGPQNPEMKGKWAGKGLCDGPKNPELKAKWTEVQILRSLIRDARQAGDKAKAQELKSQIQPLRQEMKAIRQQKFLLAQKKEEPSTGLTELQELRYKTIEAKMAFREAKQSGESKERIEALRKAKIEMWKEWKQQKMVLKSTKNVM